MSIFGERLLEARKRQRMTQQDLADRVGVTRSAIGGYELEDKDASYGVLVKIATALGVSTDFLLGMDNTAGWHRRGNIAAAFYNLELLYDRASEAEKGVIDGLLVEVNKFLTPLLENPDVTRLGRVRDLVCDARKVMGDTNE